MNRPSVSLAPTLEKHGDRANHLTEDTQTGAFRRRGARAGTP